MKTKKQREREWRRHCVEMQNALNKNNWNRYGWYKGVDGMCYDRSVYEVTSDGLVTRRAV